MDNQKIETLDPSMGISTRLYLALVVLIASAFLYSCNVVVYDGGPGYPYGTGFQYRLGGRVLDTYNRPVPNVPIMFNMWPTGMGMGSGWHYRRTDRNGYFYFNVKAGYEGMLYINRYIAGAVPGTALNITPVDVNLFFVTTVLAVKAPAAGRAGGRLIVEMRGSPNRHLGRRDIVDLPLGHSDMGNDFVHLHELYDRGDYDGVLRAGPRYMRKYPGLDRNRGDVVTRLLQDSQSRFTKKKRRKKERQIPEAPGAAPPTSDKRGKVAERLLGLMTGQPIGASDGAPEAERQRDVERKEDRDRKRFKRAEELERKRVEKAEDLERKQLEKAERERARVEKAEDLERKQLEKAERESERAREAEERERARAEKAEDRERKHLEKATQERARAEKAQGQERARAEKAEERERKQLEKATQERARAEKAQGQERARAEKAKEREREQVAKAQREKKRLEKLRREEERDERAALERERTEAARLEAASLERERAERAARAAQERARAEADRLEKGRQRENAERARQEKERAEAASVKRDQPGACLGSNRLPAPLAANALKGRCFEFSAELVELKGKKAGVFSVGRKVLYIEFKRPFSGRVFKGRAEVLGIKKVSGGRGGGQILPHLKALD